MIKLVYFSREAHTTDHGGRLNFVNFETDRIEDCVAFMKQLKDKQLASNPSKSGSLYVMATGGGAYKFYEKIKAELGVDVIREDEMECLIIGECLHTPNHRGVETRESCMLTCDCQDWTSSSQRYREKSSHTRKRIRCTLPSLRTTFTPICL